MLKGPWMFVLGPVSLAFFGFLMPSGAEFRAATQELSSSDTSPAVVKIGGVAFQGKIRGFEADGKTPAVATLGTTKYGVVSLETAKFKTPEELALALLNAFEKQGGKGAGLGIFSSEILIVLQTRDDSFISGCTDDTLDSTHFIGDFKR